MLLPSYGSFLTESQKNEAKYRFNKPLIRLCCVGFLCFSLGGIAALGVAMFHAVYTAPHAIVPAVAYSRAQTTSNRVTKSLSVIKEAHPQNIDVCKTISYFSEGVVRSNGNVSIKDITVSPKTYTIKCIGKDIAAANEFLNDLPFESNKFNKQLTDIKTSREFSDVPPMPGPAMPGSENSDSVVNSLTNNAPVDFTVIVTPKVAEKKAAPRPNANANANANAVAQRGGIS